MDSESHGSRPVVEEGGGRDLLGVRPGPVNDPVYDTILVKRRETTQESPLERRRQDNYTVAPGVPRPTTQGNLELRRNHTPHRRKKRFRQRTKGNEDRVNERQRGQRSTGR